MSSKNERVQLYEIASNWLQMARRSAEKGDYQGERHALDYVRKIVKTLLRHGERDSSW